MRPSMLAHACRQPHTHRCSVYLWQNCTISTGMASLLPPRPSTSLVSSTMHTNFLDAISTIFSRSSAPPRPFTTSSLGSTSSAPSIATSMAGCSSSVARGMPRDLACSSSSSRDSSNSSSSRDNSSDSALGMVQWQGDSSPHSGT
jgi:hypothetical protein